MSRSGRMFFALAVAAGAMLAATLVDPWAYQTLILPGVYEKDWGRLLRIMGFLPTWAIVSAAILLGGPRDAPRVRAFLPLIAAAAGGIVAEVLKLLLRRERPVPHEGEYFFRAWSDRPFSSGGLALPSSHALVAFAAAAMLARMYPRAAWLWYSLAAGCGLTRVLARAHFLSDVVLAALVGWLVAALLDSRVNREQGAGNRTR